MLGLHSELERTKKRLKSQRGFGSLTEIKVAKNHEDMKNHELSHKVAYHIGYQVPAYGRQLLNECLLTLDPSQPIYCDTDSIIYKVNRELLKKGIHKKLTTGPFLGNLADECVGKRILEVVVVAPKSYAITMEDKKTKKQEIKLKFKGIPLCSATYSLTDPSGNLAKLGLEEMKKLVESGVWSQAFENGKGVTFELKYKNVFKRNVKNGKIEPREEKKTARFTFDKRRILKPPIETKGLNDVREINTDAWGSDTVSLTDDEVIRFWKKQKKEETKLSFNGAT